MSIEVLGRDSLNKGEADASRWYRIDRDKGPQLLTYDEIKEAIKQRRKGQQPLRRIKIVLYENSPAQDVLVVKQLVDWIKDLDAKGGDKVKVDSSGPGANAPMK